MSASVIAAMLIMVLAAWGDGADAPAVPRLFLDKSPRIVEFQLKRLTNEQLAIVPRDTDDPKYVPVYKAILSRVGMPRQYRVEAVAALVKLTDSPAVVVLLDAIGSLPADANKSSVASEADAGELSPDAGLVLAKLLYSQPAEDLAGEQAVLTKAANEGDGLQRIVAMASLIKSGLGDRVIAISKTSPEAAIAYLKAVTWLRQQPLLLAQRATVSQLLKESKTIAQRQAAIMALAAIPGQSDHVFATLAEDVSDPRLANYAIGALASPGIANRKRDPKLSRHVIDTLVKRAESTAAKDRTTPAFYRSMDVIEKLLPALPIADAKTIRDRLREFVVPVVQLHTIEEEMRYDKPYFAVQAGRDVQLVLVNDDLMPHNLVITRPGKLQSVALAGAALGNNVGYQGLTFVPESEDVLFATKMIGAHQRGVLTFTAPDEPGEYPFVCTFPGHWMRMYGVMVVVEDVDQWNLSGAKPKDPLGSNRAFVQSWKVDDFSEGLANAIAGRHAKIGQTVFTQASCAQCHKMAGQGGNVGPDLTDVLKRHKGDVTSVLREILDPSHTIDPKYMVSVVLTLDGNAISGIIVDQDKEQLRLLSNPEASEPMVIKQDDIDTITKSDQSMMPKALLDRFTRDEVYELLAYLIATPPAN